MVVALAATTAVAASLASASASKSRAPLCLGKPATIVGTAKADTLRGTAKADVIAGLGGDDTIVGLGGNDLVCGGPGDDVIVGGPGRDRVDGGPGFDVCRSAEALQSCEETAPALPIERNLAPGRYTTDLFRPRIALTVGSDWLGDEQTPLHVDVVWMPQLATSSPVVDFDSSAAAQSVGSVVAAIRAEQGLNATEPMPATIGTASGEVFEVSIPPTDSLVFVPDTARFEIDPGDRARVFVVGVAGRTVVVIAGGTAENYGQTKPTLDAVLESVEWEG